MGAQKCRVHRTSMIFVTCEGRNQEGYGGLHSEFNAENRGEGIISCWDRNQDAINRDVFFVHEPCAQNLGARSPTDCCNSWSENFETKELRDNVRRLSCKTETPRQPASTCRKKTMKCRKPHTELRTRGKRSREGSLV